MWISAKSICGTNWLHGDAVTEHMDFSKKVIAVRISEIVSAV